MIVLVDMDGIVAKLEEPWLALYNKDYDDCLVSEDMTDFDWSKIVKPECGTKIFSYLATEGLFLNCEPYENSVDALLQLYLDKHELYFVTKAHNLAKFAVIEKMDWVDKHFPFIGRDKVICTGYKHLIRGDVLIDDYHKNFRGFQGKKLLFDRPWNRSACEIDLVRVYTWDHVLYEIENM